MDQTLTPTMTPDYSAVIRTLHRERSALLRRVWVAAVTLAALAVAVLPWPLLGLLVVWLALVAWLLRDSDSPGYCE